MKLKIYEDRNDLLIKLNSFAVALMVASLSIVGLFSRLFASLSNSGNIIVLGAVCIVIFISVIMSQKIYVSIPGLVIMGLVTSIFLLTLLLNSARCDYTPIQFIFYAVIPIYVICQKIDGEYVTRYIMYLSLFTLPVINKFFEIQYESFSQAYMGNIFVILTPVLVGMIHFKLYRKKSNILTKIAYLYNLYVLILIFLYANRGAVVCVLFGLAVVLINAYNEKERIKVKPIKLIIIVVCAILAILVLINLEAILVWLSELCTQMFNSVPSFISKMIRYIRKGDISDGRTNISDFTYSFIMDKPIFGHGMETFASYSQPYSGNVTWPYPHNYVLQYLFEGGIVFAILPVWLSLSLSAKVLFARIVDKKEFALCATLVCSCIPKLFMSTDPWDSTTIWMLVTYSLIYTLRQHANSKKSRIAKNYNY